jgi:hypothetical protein
MALIKNAELWFVRCVPNRPNKKFNRENPTWEVQIRTYSSAQRKEWEAQGLTMKAVVPEEDGEKPYWKTTLKKRIYKKSGEESDPVEVKKGNLEDCDPAIVGNKSIGDVRVYQYEYTKEVGGKGVANVLQGIKLTRLVKYTPKPHDDDFEETEMEVVDEDDETEVQTSTDDADDEVPVAKPKIAVKKDKFD